MHGRGALMGAAIAFAIASSSGAAEQDERPSICGHLEELAAAKRALEEAHRAQAIRHLRNADALLSRCQEGQEPRGQDDAGESRKTA